MKTIALLFAVTAGLAFQAAPASADTLLIQRVQAEQSAHLPKRGISMAQVEAQFGAPSQKFAAVAGPNDRKHNPPITRWQYDNFSVYFENTHVVDAVLTKASPEEIGPAPVKN
jgi:hypothetical protein